MVDVVERVINEEIEFGNFAKLETDFLAEIEADGLGVGLDVIEDFLAVAGRENAEIDTGRAEVGSNMDSADRNQHTMSFCRLEAENFAQFLLDEALYFR